MWIYAIYAIYMLVSSKHATGETLKWTTISC